MNTYLIGCHRCGTVHGPSRAASDDDAHEQWRALGWTWEDPPFDPSWPEPWCPSVLAGHRPTEPRFPVGGPRMSWGCKAENYPHGCGWAKRDIYPRLGLDEWWCDLCERSGDRLLSAHPMPGDPDPAAVRADSSEAPA